MAAATPNQTVVIHVTPGTIFDGRWRIEALLGQGAMGSVFRGRDVAQDRVVAIKILAPEHCRKPKVLARFEREAELMMSMRHPNLVRLHGHGRRGLLPYLVMEYLEGLTLADVKERQGGRLPVPETVAVVKQIAAGLACLHDHDLVHRDIKPQNVFWTSGGRIAILDLGVARDQANPGLTRPGAMVGTPYYMSPEQIQGRADLDWRTDVYALAAMTFELLTGRPPFLGASNFEVLRGHRNAPVPDASALVPSIPQAVAQVLGRGMSKRREARPQSASDFAAALEASSGSTGTIELARAFKAAMNAPSPKEPPSEPPAGAKTRVIARPAASGRGAEVPMAESSDVVSLGEGDEATGRHPLGGAPDPETDATLEGTAPDLPAVPASTRSR